MKAPTYSCSNCGFTSCIKRFFRTVTRDGRVLTLCASRRCN